MAYLLGKGDRSASMAKIIFLQDIVWDGTVSRGGQNMFILQWMRGLERLGHEVVFLDFIGSGFEAGREAMLRAFDQVIHQVVAPAPDGVGRHTNAGEALWDGFKSDRPFRGCCRCGRHAERALPSRAPGAHPSCEAPDPVRVRSGLYPPVGGSKRSCGHLR